MFKFQLFLLNLVAAFALTATATLVVDALAIWILPQKDAYRCTSIARLVSATVFHVCMSCSC
jgi:hypothetical protein